MDGELGIYNKMGGGEKYKNISIMSGGAPKNTESDEKKARILRLEKKIALLENELKKLKKNNI